MGDRRSRSHPCEMMELLRWPGRSSSPTSPTPTASTRSWPAAARTRPARTRTRPARAADATAPAWPCAANWRSPDERSGPPGAQAAPDRAGLRVRDGPHARRRRRRRPVLLRRPRLLVHELAVVVKPDLPDTFVNSGTELVI